MYPHPAISDMQIEQLYAEAARRAVACRRSPSPAGGAPLLDRLGSLARALRGRPQQRVGRRNEAADVRRASGAPPRRVD